LLKASPNLTKTTIKAVCCKQYGASTAEGNRCFGAAIHSQMHFCKPGEYVKVCYGRLAAKEITNTAQSNQGGRQVDKG
jgi:hypothetical protein